MNPTERKRPWRRIVRNAAGTALVIAALSAEGKSSVSGVKHIKRGYDRLEENLKSLGADIKTVEIS